MGAADRIQPVVLVGGRSSRFGRDKLCEPWRGSEGGVWLVDQPRLVLRRVFGCEPWAVGQCDAHVAARFTRVVPDDRPGLGPVAGIRAALDAAGGPIFVLAGDLPSVECPLVRAIADAAAAAPCADAVLALTDRLEPCIGVYRPSIRSRLDGDSLALHRLLADATLLRVPIDPAHARNLNTLADLDAILSVPPHPS